MYSYVAIMFVPHTLNITPVPILLEINRPCVASLISNPGSLGSVTVTFDAVGHKHDTISQTWELVCAKPCRRADVRSSPTLTSLARLLNYVRYKQNCE